VGIDCYEKIIVAFGKYKINKNCKKHLSTKKEDDVKTKLRSQRLNH
jgi:ribosomal protein L35